MKIHTSGLVALAGTVMLTAQPSLAESQSEAIGFIDGSSLTLLNKNYLFSRDYKSAGSNPDLRDRRDWAHGLEASFSSGYTQGTIGLGLDLHARAAFKLDSSRNAGAEQTGIIPLDARGRARDNYAYLGGSLKARISKTELKAGDLFPDAPVFATGTEHMFNSSARGFQLVSNEIDGLSLDAGRFTAIRDGNNSTNRDGLISLTWGGDVDARSATYFGGYYELGEQVNATLFTARLEDVWNQHFAGLNYILPLQNDNELEFDFNLYDTHSTGKRLAGKIDNTAWSLATAYSTGAHRITLSYQHVDGNEPFDYISMDDGNYGDSIWLANSNQYSDFNGPNEKSWRLRYDLDMDYFGVPGLGFMLSYTQGRGIDDSRYDGGPNGVYGWYSAEIDGKRGKHWERNLEVQYVLQSGPAKDLALRLRHATHRDNGFSENADELRLIAEYPLEIF